MGSSVNSNGKDRVLLLVEGDSAEPSLFRSLSEKFDLPFDIVSYGTNLYKLYERIVDGAGFLNLKEVLIEKVNEDCKKYEDRLNDPSSTASETARNDWQKRLKKLEEERLTLQGDFAYTYLVYDCEIHHRDNGGAETVDEARDRNLPILEKMLEYFVDETDETVGRLYVNYPMVESWRDADAFFDEQYQDSVVSLDAITRDQYKSRVSQKRLSGKHAQLLELNVDKTRLLDYRYKFESIIRMMVFKLNRLANGEWAGLGYRRYRECSEGTSILKKEAELMRTQRQISVLNTSLYAVLDYRGNKNGDYDRIVKGRTDETI